MTRTRSSPETLGPVLSRHDVDNERVLRLGGWALAGGVLGALLSALVLAGNGSSRSSVSGQPRIPDVLIGLSTAALIGGVIYLWRGLSGRDEYFEVREAGLVHALRGRTRTYPWERIAYVRIRVNTKADSTMHYLGGQYLARIRVRGRRRRVSFNGRTARHRALGAALLTHCPPAPRRSARNRLCWLAVAVVSVAGAALLIRYAATRPDTEHRIDHGTFTEVVTEPGISDTGAILITFIALSAAVLAITGVVLAFRKD